MTVPTSQSFASSHSLQSTARQHTLASAPSVVSASSTMTVSSPQSLSTSHSPHSTDLQQVAESAPSVVSAASMRTAPTPQPFQSTQRAVSSAKLQLPSGSGSGSGTGSAAGSTGAGTGAGVSAAGSAAGSAGSVAGAGGGAGAGSSGSGDAADATSKVTPSTLQSRKASSSIAPCIPIWTVVETSSGIVSWATRTSSAVPASNVRGAMANTAPSVTSSSDVSVHASKSIPIVDSAPSPLPSLRPTVSHESKAASALVSIKTGLTPPTSAPKGVATWNAAGNRIGPGVPEIDVAASIPNASAVA